MARQENVSSKDRQTELEKKAGALGMSPEEIGKLMIIAEIMKQPNALEQARADEQAKKRANEIIELGLIEQNKMRNIMAEQMACPHQRDDGKHTWAGQTLGPGNMYAKGFCVRCQKAYYWKSSSEQIQNGLGLQENKGIREINLQNEERFRPCDPKWLLKIGDPRAAVRHQGYIEELAKRTEKAEKKQPVPVAV